MQTRLERVVRHDGIVAAMGWTTDDRRRGADPIWVGEERWKPLVKEAVRLREIANEPAVRVLVGEHACLLSGDEDNVVAVVFLKGHPIVKSVARMTRRLLNKSARRQPQPTEPAPVVEPGMDPPRLASGM